MKKLIRSTDRTSALVAALYTVNREIISPILFSLHRPHCQRADFRLGEYQCLNYLSSNTPMLGDFKIGKNRLKGKKGKNNPVKKCIHVQKC